MPQFCFHLNETTIFLSPFLSQIFVDTSESICIVLQHIWETGVRPYLLLLLFYKSCCTGHFRNLQIVVPLPFLLCHVLKLKCHLQNEPTIELCTLNPHGHFDLHEYTKTASALHLIASGTVWLFHQSCKTTKEWKTGIINRALQHTLLPPATKSQTIIKIHICFLFSFFMDLPLSILVGNIMDVLTTSSF